MKISVVICTHNPRQDYIQRTIEGLKAQTIPKDQWELLIIDNVSNPPLDQLLDLSWHPHSRIIVENELGILPARVRGMMETSTPLILFVDDDNILSPDYLERGLDIDRTFSFLGCWGGELVPEFEVVPPSWIESQKLILAIVSFDEDRWSNLKISNPTIPPTAGMFLRRNVINQYLNIIKSDPRRALLGRRGKLQLTNGEDTDIALSSCDIGLGTGQFKSLKLKHIIPKERLEISYLVRLYEGSCCCGMLLDYFRGKDHCYQKGGVLNSLLGKIKRKIFWEEHKRLFFEAKMRGFLKASEIIKSWKDKEI
jgi:glycosyltransferase involved in cell wall biosynthesis